MSNQQTETPGVEWRVNLGDGSSKILVMESATTHACASRVWHGLKMLVARFVLDRVWRFLMKAWDLGVDDPRKVIHCIKVGMALVIVSLFYYMRPLYEGLGGNAMWAIMTVVVVFENTVGATICKSLNRVTGTTVAGFLAFGVHWIASLAGERFEPLIIGASIFVLGLTAAFISASAATFSRFLPTVKERFDYGAMIFILTFSLIAVSGYRVEKLFEMAHHRMATIIIGTSLCIIISILICPIWAGQELHSKVCSNMDKLANSLEGCLTECFRSNSQLANKEVQSDKRLLGYKCVLSSKGSEDAMIKFARWEPAHGRFNFGHPWKQYLKIGASMRNCAYYIDALNSCIESEIQAPEFLRNHLSNGCLRLSASASSILKELAKTLKTMKKSSEVKLLKEEMNAIVQELQSSMNSLSEVETSSTNIDLIEAIPVVTVASILIEIAVRIEDIVEAVEVLSNSAGFKSTLVYDQGKSNPNHTSEYNDKRVTDAASEDCAHKNIQIVRD